MKADEPENRARLVKYGLPASEVPAFEAGLSEAMEERRLFEALEFQHALNQGPAVAALLASLKGEAVPAPIPVAPPEPVCAAPAPEPPVQRKRAVAAMPGLRASLGLT